MELNSAEFKKMTTKERSNIRTTSFSPCIMVNLREWKRKQKPGDKENRTHVSLLS